MMTHSFMRMQKLIKKENLEDLKLSKKQKVNLLNRDREAIKARATTSKIGTKLTQQLHPCLQTTWYLNLL